VPICIGVLVDEQGRYVNVPVHEVTPYTFSPFFSSYEQIEKTVRENPSYREYTPRIYCFDLEKHGRYLVFAGDEEPKGGWKDFVGATDDLGEAKRFCKTFTTIHPDGWAEIVDRQTGEVVESYTWENWEAMEAFLKSKYRAGSPFQREREESRRYGQPRTEEERLERHYERYGTTELPPRGTGLRESSVSQIPTCPICGEPMKKIIGNLYQCPNHPTETVTLAE